MGAGPMPFAVSWQHGTWHGTTVVLGRLGVPRTGSCSRVGLFSSPGNPLPVFAFRLVT